MHITYRYPALKWRERETEAERVVHDRDYLVLGNKGQRPRLAPPVTGVESPSSITGGEPVFDQIRHDPGQWREWVPDFVRLISAA
jgi:hypothetical protein